MCFCVDKKKCADTLVGKSGTKWQVVKLSGGVVKVSGGSELVASETE